MPPPASSGFRYAGTEEPDDMGQFGVGARYQLTPTTRAGLYYLRYNARQPSVVADFMTSTYKVLYPDRVKMVGLTTSSLVSLPQGILQYLFGSFAFATETSYHWEDPLLLDGLQTDITRGHVIKQGISVLDNFGRTPLAPQTTLLVEVEGAYRGGADTHSADLSNGRTAGAYHINLNLDYPGILPGVELSIPLNYAYTFDGSIAGVGASGGDYAIGVDVTWHQNLKVGLAYKSYTGDHVHQPLTDRDFVALTAKYSM